MVLLLLQQDTMMSQLPSSPRDNNGHEISRGTISCLKWFVEKGFNQIKKIGLFIEHYGYFKGHMHVYYCY